MFISQKKKTPIKIHFKTLIIRFGYLYIIQIDAAWRICGSFFLTDKVEIRSTRSVYCHVIVFAVPRNIHI